MINSHLVTVLIRSASKKLYHVEIFFLFLNLYIKLQKFVGFFCFSKSDCMPKCKLVLSDSSLSAYLTFWFNRQGSLRQQEEFPVLALFKAILTLGCSQPSV